MASSGVVRVPLLCRPRPRPRRPLFRPLSDLPSTLRQLGLSLVPLGNGTEWVLIVPAHIDAFVAGEPFLSRQILHHRRTGQTFVRVWGRTAVKCIAKGDGVLAQICWTIFHKAAPCRGIEGGERSPQCLLWFKKRERKSEEACSFCADLGKGTTEERTPTPRNPDQGSVRNDVEDEQTTGAGRRKRLKSSSDTFTKDNTIKFTSSPQTTSPSPIKQRRGRPPKGRPLRTSIDLTIIESGECSDYEGPPSEYAYKASNEPADKTNEKSESELSAPTNLDTDTRPILDDRLDNEVDPEEVVDDTVHESALDESRLSDNEEDNPNMETHVIDQDEGGQVDICDDEAVDDPEEVVATNIEEPDSDPEEAADGVKEALRMTQKVAESCPTLKDDQDGDCEDNEDDEDYRPSDSDCEENSEDEKEEHSKDTNSENKRELLAKFWDGDEQKAEADGKKCPQCHNDGPSYSTWGDLRKHLCTEHAFDNYVCNDCGDFFSFPDKFIDHMKSEHGCYEEALLVCPGCKVPFLLGDFEEHATACHGYEKSTKGPGVKKQFRCEHCPKKFVNSAQLDRHMRTKHKMQFKHRCDQCDFEGVANEVVT